MTVIANYFKQCAPSIWKRAMAYAQAGTKPDSKSALTQTAALPCSLDRSDITSLSAPEQNRLFSFFNCFAEWGKAQAKIVSRPLSNNHESIMNRVILPNLHEIKKHDITVTKRSSKREPDDIRVTQTEGSVKINDAVFKFKAEITYEYTLGKNNYYYKLLLTQAETGFSYYFNNIRHHLESKLGEDSFPIDYYKQKPIVETFIKKLIGPDKNVYLD